LLLDEVRLRYVDQTVVLVSHGGTVRLVLCLLLGHPLSAYWQFEVDNTAIAEIELQDRGPVLIRWNDTHHLTDGHRQSVF
jgi:broad specificity phosphatase PhoE